MYAPGPRKLVSASIQACIDTVDAVTAELDRTARTHRAPCHATDELIADDAGRVTLRRATVRVVESAWRYP